MISSNKAGSGKRVERTSSTLRKRRMNDFGGDWNELKQQNLEVRKTDYRQFLTKKGILGLIQTHFPRVITVVLAIGCALWYLWYTSTLFESTTHFSHLSNVERELSLPTDVAFRYSFFKKIAEAKGYLDGLRLVTQDQRKEQVPHTASSFHRHSLSPETFLAGVFHGLKHVKSWVGWPGTSCKVVSPEGSITNGNTIFTSSKASSSPSSLPPRRQGGLSNFTEESGGSQDFFGNDGDDDKWTEDSFRLSCSGLADPLHFYLASVRFLECGITILIFFMGLHFGNSLVGGFLSVIFFVCLHPQRSNYEWLFPVPEKIGWILVLLQSYMVFRTVFTPVHPSWRSVVKIGIPTAILILGWNQDAQWFLTSQLIITALLHICGALSRYLTSLVIFGQLTGWQYATLVSLDPSFHHWSFFLYTLVTSTLTFFVIEPLFDWILGRKRDNWRFLRASILLITFQTILISVRCDFGQMFAFLEDSRFPLTMGDPHEDGPAPWIISEEYPVSEESSGISPGIYETLGEDVSRDGLGESEGWRNGRTGAFSPITRTTISSKEKASASEVNGRNPDTLVSLQMTEFLRSCFLSQAKFSTGKFLTKNFFLIMAAVYTIIVSILVPFILSRSTSKTQEENTDLLWRWDSYLSFHMAQTLFFALFCLWLDKRWEVFFVPHVCLLLTLLSDFRKTLRMFKASPFSYALHLHWALVIAIVGILVASARLRSNAMHQKSRGRFEIGNSRVVHLVEAVKWIREHTESLAGFAGADNLMVALDLTAQRRAVTHHLTLHSWSNQMNPSLPNHPPPTTPSPGKRHPPRGKYESATIRASPPAQLPIRAQDAMGVIRDHYELQSNEEEEDEEEKDDEEKSPNSELLDDDWDEGKFGGSERIKSLKLDHPPSSARRAPVGSPGEEEWAGEDDHYHNLGGGEEDPRMIMTALLTRDEMESLVKVYSIFRRGITLQEFHGGLLSLNISYLVISEQMCSFQLPSLPSPQDSPQNVLGDFAGSSSVITSPRGGHSSHRNRHHIPRDGGWTASSARSREESPPPPPFRPDKDEEEPGSINFTSGIWQWQWNWQEPTHHLLSPYSVQFPKRCDFPQFWNGIENPGKKRPNEGEAEPHVNLPPEMGTQHKWNGRGNPSSSFRLKKYHASNNNFKSWKSNQKAQFSTAAEEELGDILCTRLLRERNVRPFTRVFQNPFVTILQL